MLCKVSMVMVLLSATMVFGVEAAEQELLIDNAGTVIAGTLLTPDQAPADTPLVIMISGSGAQDRNSEVFGFPMFETLANSLQEEGIATFRYDDRQTGASEGDFAEATLDRLSADVAVIVDHFTVFRKPEFAEIILLGHSQGGLVAARLAGRDTRIDRLVLLATTGINMRRVLRRQVAEAYATLSVPPELIEQEISAREELMYAISDDTDIEAAQAAYANAYLKVLEQLPAEQRRTVPDPEGHAASQAIQLTQAYSSPQMQSFLYHDPVSDLTGMEIPVLMVFGGKDVQVDEAVHRPILEEVLTDSGTDYHSAVIPEANHLFQTAETGQVAEYQLLEKAFAPELTQLLSEWLSDELPATQSAGR